LIPDIKPELQEMIDKISRRSMYSGNKIPDSIMRLFEIIETDTNAGVLVPFWIPVLQKGRGPRKSTTDHKLYLKIYHWMAKKNMFVSKTEEGKISEAKSLTWYINKYGNKHFRDRRFVDIYQTAREETIKQIDTKVWWAIDKITMEVI
jgi:hypothetical protein